MLKAIILIGPPGSGKTTYRNSFLKENPDYICISPDEIRKEVTGDEADQSADARVWGIVRHRFEKALQEKRNVVIDATNYKVASRKDFKKASLAAGYEVVAVDMFAGLDIATIKTRNAARSRVCPEFIIDNMVKGYVPPSYGEGFTDIIRPNEKTYEQLITDIRESIAKDFRLPGKFMKSNEQ